MGLGDKVMRMLTGRQDPQAPPPEPLNYPARLELNGQTIELRPMTAQHAEGMLAFARGLPPHDLLFLPRDITRPEVVSEWVEDLEADRYVTILALRGKEIIGYTTVASEGLDWTRHVAELRVLVSPSARGLRLGRVLTEQAFALAGQRGVRKMLAQMTTDQHAAIRVFDHLGFVKEGRLRNQLIDRDGQLHDLQIMSLDVDEFRAKSDAVATE